MAACALGAGFLVAEEPKSNHVLHRRSAPSRAAISSTLATPDPLSTMPGPSGTESPGRPGHRSPGLPVRVVAPGDACDTPVAGWPLRSPLPRAPRPGPEHGSVRPAPAARLGIGLPAQVRLPWMSGKGRR